MSSKQIQEKSKTFTLIENYIYLYHIDKFILLPTWPEQVSDSLSSTFTQTNPLARSAPVFSYSHSGPRTVQINLKLHREMMTQINYEQSNLNLNNLKDIQDASAIGINVGDDYVDVMLKELQAIALPRYTASNKLVNPPLVALRFGNEIYIKGIVNNGITVTYSGPILGGGNNSPFENKYAIADISFTITEVDPYDADSIQRYGSFRGLNETLERRIFKKN